MNSAISIKHLVVLNLVCAAAVTVRAQSTAFTYTGRLAANGASYTGFAEMQFALFSAPIGGVAVAASTPTIAAVNVTGGQFSASLNFGASAFTGADRFLQIQVRTNPGPFFTLAPRQALSPVPSALYAYNAGPWALNGNNVSYTGGNVGIGTATPGAGLHIKKEAIPPGGTLALEGETHTYVTLFPEGVAKGRKGYFGFPSSDSRDITIANEFLGGRIVLFDGSGPHFPSAGQESLRIVRGKVFFDGGRRVGSGFESTRRNNGRYTVTFDQPFLSLPAVTATPDTTEQVLPEDFPQHMMISFVAVDSFNLENQTATEGGWFDCSFHFIAIGAR